MDCFSGGPGPEHLLDSRNWDGLLSERGGPGRRSLSGARPGLPASPQGSWARPGPASLSGARPGPGGNLSAPEDRSLQGQWRPRQACSPLPALAPHCPNVTTFSIGESHGPAQRLIASGCLPGLIGIPPCSCSGSAPAALPVRAPRWPPAPVPALGIKRWWPAWPGSSGKPPLG